MSNPVAHFAEDRLRVLGTGTEDTLEALATSVRATFARDPRESGEQRSLSCHWLYDRAGSLLFEEICRQPEYYPTRCEEEILRRRAAEILDGVPARTAIVELGSGSARKTRHLLEAALARDGAATYVPIDISRSMLVQSSHTLLDAYPSLSILGIAAEYSQGLHLLGEHIRGPKLVLWLGSNVGNFERPDAVKFLKRLREDFGSDDRFLMGVDLRKDKDVLERAYDDAAGVTSRFSLNLLTRLNRELDADFDLSGFRHVAEYEEDSGRVLIYVESLRDQRVRIGALDVEVDLCEGERIHQESSVKYSPDELDALAEAAGFRVESRWFDDGRRFSLSALAPS